MHLFFSSHVTPITCRTVDRTLVSVGNHDLGFLAPRQLVFPGAPTQQLPQQLHQSTQLWRVQSSTGQPSVKSELLILLLRAILKRPGISDQDLAWQLPVIPISDIRDVSLPPPPLSYITEHRFH